MDNFGLDSEGLKKQDHKIKFEDEKLFQVVKEALNKIEGELYLSDVISLKKLEAKRKGIESLEGIQFLMGLRDLDISANQLSDITPIENLRNLESLRFWGNRVSDISAVKNLTRLKILDFSGNDVENLSALKYLVNLSWLNLENNKVTDVSPLLANIGFGNGDEIAILNNNLKLWDPRVMKDINDLLERGVLVSYKP